MQQPVDFHTLFTQLQTRFPCSTLVTELVQVYEGSFVVRALVQSGGVTLATGMAAAASVELAEDQARLRVLSIFGIPSVPADAAAPSLRPLGTNGHLSSKSSSPSEIGGSISPGNISSIPGLPLPSIENFLIEEPVLPLLTEPDTSLSPLPTPDYSVNQTHSAPDADPPTHFVVADTFDSEEDVFLPDYEPSLPELPLPELSTAVTVSDRSSTADLPNFNVPKVDKPSKSSKVIEPGTDELDDLSSLIALTDVEMDRIGWTKQEGRQYLKQTYSKSTRQSLTFDELLDFLNYLRARPSTDR
ncbi:MAG: hypothetical protein HC866_07245 [Leptolyngbyaceae cyanobacterium RU_5_1]|nr:hypothetical protein [Leptolyngbyaceae cyanobacterium RU_5_1]